MTALLQTLDIGHRPAGVLRAGQAPAGGAPRRLRVAATCRRARASRASCTRTRTRSSPRRTAAPTQVTDAEALIRLLLDQFLEVVGEERMNVPEDRGHDLLPDRDAGLDRRARGDRRRGAGAHRRRLPEPARRPARRRRRSSTPTRRSPTRPTRWRSRTCRSRSGRTYFFWKVPAEPARRRPGRPRRCRATRPTRSRGLIPGPISTPSLASIDAALEPDQTGRLPVLRGHPGHDRSTPSRRRSRSTTRTCASTATCDLETDR